jgi:hypothetical protein
LPSILATHAFALHRRKLVRHGATGLM